MNTEHVSACQKWYKILNLPNHIQLPFFSWFRTANQDRDVHTNRLADDIN